MNRAERRRQEKLAKKSKRALKTVPTPSAEPSVSPDELFAQGAGFVANHDYQSAAPCFLKAVKSNPEIKPDLSCFEKPLASVGGRLSEQDCLSMTQAIWGALQGTSTEIRIPPVCVHQVLACNLSLGDQAPWRNLVETKKQALIPLGFDSRTAINRHIGFMGLSAMVYGVDFALNQMIDIFDQAPVAIRDAGLPARATNVATIQGSSSDHAFWFTVPLPETTNRLRSAVSRELEKGNTGCGIIILLHLMGFLKKAPPEWMAFLFSEILLPTLDQAVQLRRYDAAMGLEGLVYMAYVQQVESKEHYRNSLSQIWPGLRELGKSYGAQYPAKPDVLPTPLSSATPPVVAFYLHATSILGHTEVFLSFLRGLSQQDTPQIQPLIYIGHTEENALTEEFDALNIPRISVEKLDPHTNGYANTWMAVKKDCQRRGVQAFCFISLVTEMAFAFAFKLAPVQIWWSMKYHGLSSPDIDGYLALGSFQKYKTIDDRDWRICHRSLGSLYDPALSQQAEDLRNQFGANKGTIVLGCVGRDDKLRSEPYVAALADIMNAVPNTIYLWTGRAKNPDVVALFRKYNIADRCHFIGWVNTRLYAQVFDLIVDSFPFASGLTGFESMAAGRPVLALVTPESLGTAYVNHMWPGYIGDIDDAVTHQQIKSLFTAPDGTSLLPICETVEEYVNIGIRLATDAEFRRSAGAAAQNFVTRYMHDDMRMADTFTDHVLELIDHKNTEEY